MYVLRLISSPNYQKDYNRSMVTTRTPKVSFKEQMLAAREQAIIDVVNRLLAEKGFEAMTVDEVAAAVGIAKASLYKHFPSKEDLAAAAMAQRVFSASAQTMTTIATLPAMFHTSACHSAGNLSHR